MHSRTRFTYPKASQKVHISNSLGTGMPGDSQGARSMWHAITMSRFAYLGKFKMRFFTQFSGSLELDNGGSLELDGGQVQEEGLDFIATLRNFSIRR